MKKYFTADRETGTFIDSFDTIAMALQAIEDYEESDREDGTFEENFYDIVDADHCHVDTTGYYLVDQTETDIWTERLDVDNEERAVEIAKAEWKALSDHDKKRRTGFYVAKGTETVDGYDFEAEELIADVRN